MTEGNLPLQVTAFIGRSHELAALREALAGARLTTLTGVGGVGKTRLALQASLDLPREYPDGVWFVDLGAVIDPDVVGDVVLMAVTPAHQSPQIGKAPRDRLVDALRGRELLLILDNCEQVLAAVGDLVSSLLQACPGVGVVATSREPLAVAGERTFRVPSLSLPAVGADLSAMNEADAVRLFCDRAVLVRSDFELSEHNAEAVAELCRRLDGVPLAIELAAARIATMSPAELLDRLHSRFRLLASEARGVVERHKTLRATIDWSYELLDEPERAMFRRCAVFAGGFDLQAAEQVVGDERLDSIAVLELLTRLVEKSLLSASEVHHHTRYRMLETIREYALELFSASSEAAAIQERHATYFRQFAIAAGAGLRGAQEAEWVDRLELELDNLRAAVVWAVDTFRIALATDIVVPLQIMQLAFDETIATWSEMVAAYPYPEQDPRVAAVHTFVSYVRYFHRGEPRAAETVRELLESTRETQDLSIRASVLGLASGLSLLNDWPMKPLAEEYLSVARQLGDQFHLVQGLAAVTWSEYFRGLDATETGEEAVRVANQLQNPTATAIALQAQAMVLAQKDPARAVALLDRSIALAASVRSMFTQSVGESMRTNLLVTALDPRSAVNLMLDSIEDARGQNLPGLGIIWVEEVAAVLSLHGRDEAASLLLGRARGANLVAPAFWPFAPEEYRNALAALPDRLGSDRYRQLMAQGSTMNNEEVIALARAEADHLPDTIE